MENSEFNNYSEIFPAKEKIKGAKSYDKISIATQAMFMKAVVLSVSALLSFSYVTETGIFENKQTDPTPHGPSTPVTPVNPDNPENPDNPDIPIIIEKKAPEIISSSAEYNNELKSTTVTFTFEQNDAEIIVSSIVSLDGETAQSVFNDNEGSAVIEKELENGDYTTDIEIVYKMGEQTATVSSSAQFKVDVKKPEPAKPVVQPDTPKHVNPQPTVTKKDLSIVDGSALYDELDIYLEASYLVEINDASSVDDVLLVVTNNGSSNTFEGSLTADNVAYFDVSGIELNESATVTAKVNYTISGQSKTATRQLSFEYRKPEHYEPEITSASARYDDRASSLVVEFMVEKNDDEIIEAIVYSPWYGEMQENYPDPGTTEGSYYVVIETNQEAVEGNSVVIVVSYDHYGETLNLEKEIDIEIVAPTDTPPEPIIETANATITTFRAEFNPNTDGSSSTLTVYVSGDLTDAEVTGVALYSYPEDDTEPDGIIGLNVNGDTLNADEYGYSFNATTFEVFVASSYQLQVKVEYHSTKSDYATYVMSDIIHLTR